MKIELELDYDDAVALREAIAKSTDHRLMAVYWPIDSAIDNEIERRGVAAAERLMEDGGVDDSKYRQDMKDAGRAHLIR